ncbi:UNVERIFIED_CONTAM: hypothetical protein GTU68_010975 [Idotea baltica]|nr:hypothetical protein [Idotea baltica]
MRSLKLLYPNISFVGVGGPLMMSEGLFSFFPMERLSVIGLTEVLSRLPELLFRRKKLIKHIKQIKPDVFVGIDAPDFNIDIEIKLRQVGIKTVHYVSPSIWAWRQKRVYKLQKACDLVLTLFPFEAEFYKDHHVPVRFVGHPLADIIGTAINDRNSARENLNLINNKPVVALLPGSRSGEINRLGALFIKTAEQLHKLNSEIQFVLPYLDESLRQQLELFLADKKIKIIFVANNSKLVFEACDVVLVASGTATLEALLHNRPMVVAYKVAPITFKILKKLVKSPYIALPNLLANKLIVPEFIQEKAQPDRLAKELFNLLSDKTIQTRYFESIRDQLQCDASQQAASAIMEILI